MGLRANPRVFFTSAGLVLLFVVYGTALPDHAEKIFGHLQVLITDSLGWLFNGGMTFFFLFVLGIALSPYGKIRLGPDDSRPDYSYFTWFSMLFTAGMGIGVLFWAVAEPVTHYLKPPEEAAASAAAAGQAMVITLRHWGLHGWGVYAMVGLCLAYFSYRRGMPLTFRSALTPLLGQRIHGVIGDAIDVFAVLGTMFGVATSLGLGAGQINAGLEHLLSFKATTGSQLLLIGLITLFATASVVSGIDRGIRWLSEISVWLAGALFLFILFAGPTLAALEAFVVGGGRYLADLVLSAGWSGGPGDARWQGNWTLFYWAWWIAWSPFVGIFVARVSRGRTVREFVFGVLFAPTIVTFVWFAVFGGMALEQAADPASPLRTAVTERLAVATYVFFEHLPLSGVLSVVGTLLTVVFFVTSSDSASLVIDYLSSGGDQDPPKRQRVFWAFAEGGVAVALLLGGGLTAMRSFQLCTGVPLTIVLFAMSAGLVVALYRYERPSKAQPPVTGDDPAG